MSESITDTSRMTERQIVCAEQPSADDIAEAGLQSDMSGVGHCWRAVADPTDGGIAEAMIALCDAAPGTTYRASNGLVYRVAP